MIICPYCAGENSDNAIQCKHCDKFLVSKEKGGDISADYPLKRESKGPGKQGPIGTFFNN